MQNTLILRLFDEHDQIEWLVTDETGKPIQGPRNMPISDLRSLDTESDVIAVVPGQDVYLTQAVMPKLSQAKLQKAIPYALEEQLADDIDHLHFSTGQHRPDKPLPIAVISKDRISYWLDKIHSHLPQGNHLKALLPDCLMIPWSKNAWHVWINENTAMLRTAEQNGYSIDLPNLQSLLPKMVNDTETKPEIIYIHASSRNDVPQIELTDSKIQIHIDEDSSPLLTIFQQQLNGSIPFNLLQGDYRPIAKFNKRARNWKLSAALAAAWLIVISGANILKAGYLANESQSLKNDVAVIYKGFFPNATGMVSPKKRVQRLLSSQQGNVEQGFLNMMSSVIPFVGHDKKLKVQELSYKNNKLHIKLEAQEFRLLDDLTKKLNDIGLHAEQSGVTKLGNVIQTRIIIKES